MTLGVAEHRPALRRRRFKNDDLVAVDLFSGFGGLTKGIEDAGFTTIMAANHNRYKVQVHEANHPDAEHWVADLVNKDASDYHSARDLPPADMLAAGISCVNHSQANTKKAYRQGLSLFDLDDPEFEERVTRSERDRATASCVLHYAAQHHPRLILVECTTELTSWGPQVPGKKCGDGSTYRWWIKQFELLGYKYRVLYLNSQFFGVPQSRDRIYIAMWDAKLPTPDLDHRPHSWCDRCDKIVEAVWTWRTGVPPTGSVRYGKQYEYRCPSCRCVVVPPLTPSLAALDLSDLGTRIGDREKPLAASTMARAERCRQRLAEFPAVLLPAKAARGSDCRSRDLSQPLWSQTATNTTCVITPPIALAVDNYQGVPRGAGEPLPTQGGSETMALLSSGVVPFRKNTVPTTHAEAMPTVTAEQIPGVLTAAGRVQCNGSIDEAKYRSYPLDRPLGTVVGSAITQGRLFSGWFKQNGTSPEQFPAPPLLAEWRAALAELPLEDCYFRMMAAHEVGRGCGFDVDFADHKGTFVVWGSARNQVDGYGNAVSPPVGTWIGARLRSALHRLEAA
ncbi:DNA cytosine methyltransferase [Mycolicibacterium goodii]|uniref:DNA cytosine methyltransferase n=1 Tax=Mycolicibacterium goodii TaxID=134601 RepID=UPI001BDD122A|nr:DNA cytosine methyltransferase [Mycolicibacterium goodii]MBU8820468.1 DNA cytosine methyltransferase [Mycolicibacterium goodii]